MWRLLELTLTLLLSQGKTAFGRYSRGLGEGYLRGEERGHYSVSAVLVQGVDPGQRRQVKTSRTTSLESRNN